MTILAVWIFLAGAILGRFFRVWILVPVSLAAVVAIVINSVWLALGPLHTFAELTLFVICLQLGYACGLFSGAVSYLWLGRKRGREEASIAATKHREAA